ncbi:MAG: hypothetical protein IPH82_02775 [Chloroflexi bacterium]|nr:hypothetical protein [Chloroflexota bacterium]
MYLLVPASSDVLYNLETENGRHHHHPHWQMEGEAGACVQAQTLPAVRLAHSPQAPGCVLAAIRCRRIHFNWMEGGATGKH